MKLGEPVDRSFSVWFQRLRVMTIKEVLQLFRDVILIFFILYAFIVDVYLAGSGVTLQLNNASMVIHDSDQSFASRELINRFRLPYFRMDGVISDQKEGIRLLDKGKSMIVLDIPPKFEEMLLNGRQISVQMQVDTTNSVLGFLASSYSSQIVGQFGLDAAVLRLGFPSSSLETVPVIRDKHRVWFNPNQNDAWFMSISELLNIITLFAVLLPATAMVREKERGTVEQLLVSPLSSFQIMMPKVLAMTAVILGGTFLSLVVNLLFLFHVPLKGSLLLFFSVTTLYVFTTAGLGLFAATIARNLAQAGMMTILILAPMFFLSGAWTPPEAMPNWLRIMMLISPLHYYIDASFGILLKGAGIAQIWGSVLAMALLGGLTFGFGIWRFRRQFG